MLYSIYDPEHAGFDERMGTLYSTLDEVRKKAYARAKRGYESQISCYIKRRSAMAYPSGYTPTKFHSKYKFIKTLGTVYRSPRATDVIFIRKEITDENKATVTVRKTVYLLNSDGSLGKKLDEDTYWEYR